MSIDEIVIDYNDGNGPQLRGDMVEKLYMIKRGKHYNEEQMGKILRGIARDFEQLARDCLELADGV